MNALRWILALILAALFLYMASFKFMPEISGSANPIFPRMAELSGITLIEPYFRWITGILEVITGLLLLAPRTRLLGVGLGLCILVGALAAHFSPFLGIDVPGVGKTVFYMAIVMTVLSVVLLFLRQGTARELDADSHGRVDS